MKGTVLKGLEIYTENLVIKNGYLIIEGTEIAEVGCLTDFPKDFAYSDYDTYVYKNNEKLVPGFIDFHIHGAAGADVMDASADALQRITEALPAEGTTSLLATTMTSSVASIEDVLFRIADYMKEAQLPGRSEIVGIHLEGPFLSRKRAGAQLSKYIIKPDIQLFKKWQAIAKDHIKAVTFAPEEDIGLVLAQYLKNNRVIASLGHSDATHAEASAAIEAGVTHATHLFNGMRGLHHREPGAAGTMLLSNSVKVELIADGLHVCPEMVELVFRLKTREGILLITDAIRAKYLGDGTYDLGGQDVTVHHKYAHLSDGTLAGSVLTMMDAAANMMTYTGCSLEDVIYMGAVNPAKQLGIFDRKGSIAPGKDADLLVIDDHHQLLQTFCKGKLTYVKS